MSPDIIAERHPDLSAYILRTIGAVGDSQADRMPIRNGPEGPERLSFFFPRRRGAAGGVITRVVLINPAKPELPWGGQHIATANIALMVRNWKRRFAGALPRAATATGF
jgi:hypothetical protein